MDGSYLRATFQYLDREYGGVEGFLQERLQVSRADIARLQQLYLE
ncbi:MAG: tyrosine-protein phosphatase [Caulobacteraceae bacterium]